MRVCSAGAADVGRPAVLLSRAMPPLSLLLGLLGGGGVSNAGLGCAVMPQPCPGSIMQCLLCSTICSRDRRHFESCSLYCTNCPKLGWAEQVLLRERRRPPSVQWCQEVSGRGTLSALPDLPTADAGGWLAAHVPGGDGWVYEVRWLLHRGLFQGLRTRELQILQYMRPW